jgi:hypothetical protein
MVTCQRRRAHTDIGGCDVGGNTDSCTVTVSRSRTTHAHRTNRSDERSYKERCRKAPRVRNKAEPTIRWRDC